MPAGRRVRPEGRSTLFGLALVVGLTLVPGRASAATGLVAVDDLFHIQAQGYGNANIVPYLANDQSDHGLDFRAINFPDDQPDGLTPAADHRSVRFDGLGTLSMTPGEFPHMEFFSDGGPGTGRARYQLVDADGQTSEAVVTVVVGPGGGAVARFRQGQQTKVDVLADDIPGLNADGTPGTIDATSVHFTVSSGGPGSTVSADGRTLTDPVRGVFQADPATGVVTIKPLRSYRGGSGEHVSYVARDTTRTADGTIEHHSYRGTIALWVTAISPQVVYDEPALTPYHASVTLPGASDDRAGDPSVPLRRDLTVFMTAGQVFPDGASLYDHGRGLRVAEQGWWTVDATGRITFSPMVGFSGQATSVVYRVQDADGNTADGVEQAWVAPGPEGEDDVATTRPRTSVAVDVLANDTPGTSASPEPGSLNHDSVHFPATGQPTGATLSTYDRVLTVPGQGVYTADRTTGVVTFAPAAALTGKATPVTYTAWDTVHRLDGRAVHNPITATLTVQVVQAGR